MKRLPGVVVSAILLIIGSLFQLLMAAAMGFGGFIEQQHLQTAANPSMPAQHAWLPFVSYGIAAICLGLTVWGAIIAFGLFRMKRWARFSALIIGGTLVFFGVPGMIMMIVMSAISLPAPAGINPAQAHTIQILSRVGFIGIAIFYAFISATGIWWLVYFNRKTVRESFGATLAPLAPPCRPILISILAVLNMIGAATCALMAILPIPLAFCGLIVHGLSKAVVLLVFAVLAAICGVGLWHLQEWARKSAIALQCIGLINYMFFVFRPTVMQRYQEEINRSMNIQQSAQLPRQFQSIFQHAIFGIGILFLLAVIAIFHYYRSAFNQPSSPASSQPELIG